jgi:hypothetical protein
MRGQAGRTAEWQLSVNTRNDGGKAMYRFDFKCRSRGKQSRGASAAQCIGCFGFRKTSDPADPFGSI